jgi:hypothetical protein
MINKTNGSNKYNDGDWPKTQTLNTKVEQFNISNLDIWAMWWQHVWAFDNLSCETLTIKLIIGQIM